MKKLFLLRLTICSLLFILFLFQTGTVQAQRKMEKLDRGLVAVRTNNGVFLSWRVLGTDPKDIAFNIYRNGTKVNGTPITGATNMVDGAGSASSNYTVRPALGGIEQAHGSSVTVWDSQVKTITLSNRPGSNHAPNDISVGDLDGDGQYELIVKWYPNNAKDNSQSGVTDNTYLDAYKLDGTFMWRIDLGINIRSGAHYTQFLVGDYDSDGFAEVACKTAPGTRDGKGNYLSKGPASGDNDAADYRNSGGYVLSGPEYLTIFNGKTGEEMATVNYVVPRGTVSSWGDNYGNRVDRFNATNAYLDGIKPSMIFQRGYYTRMVVAAFDWNGQALTSRWTFDSNNSGSERARGQGNHSIMAADIDGDGFDEILTGSACIDHDGKLKWTTGYGHGDANHVGDFDPGSPGLEVWQVSENKGSEPDHYMIRASDGHVLWRNGSGNDNGRGMIADIDARYPGQEAWSNSVAGTYRANGTQFTTSKPGSANFRIYWDGDLQDELPNGSSNNTNNRIDKWNGNGTASIFTLTGLTCNGTKATPNIVADLFGDWREEIILHDGANRLYIHTTIIPTQHKLYTLMHDPVYRNAISWQQSSYNQPPHLGFFLGAGVENAPTPNIVLVGGSDCNGVSGGSAYLDDCGTCVGGNTGKTACTIDCNGDVNGTAAMDACGFCAGGNTGRVACIGSVQGEDFCSAAGVKESINGGFTGEGYINFENALNSNGVWYLLSDRDMSVSIGVRYANGGGTARGMSLLVNGTVQGAITGASTGSWTTWVGEYVTLNLSRGANQLELRSLGSDGGPNIDLFSYSVTGLTFAGCEEDCQGIVGGAAFTDGCGVCVGGTTGKTACIQDCAGIWGGDAEEDACGVCVGGQTGFKGCAGTLEAEDACSVDGIQLESINQGFSGAGYVNTDNSMGSSITWILNSAASQTATLSFRFANGGNNARDGRLIVNQAPAGTLSLPATGAWTTWLQSTVNVNLEEGDNEIVLEAITPDGLANIDVLSFSEGISNAPCPIITGISTWKDAASAVYPNPTHGRVTWNGDKPWNLYNAQGLEINQGKGSFLDLSAYPDGIYLLKLDNNIIKVIKE